MKKYISAFKSKVDNLFKSVLRLVFLRKRGVVFVQRRCMLESENSEENIAGSRLIALFDKEQLKDVQVNGKFVSKWYKLKRGDKVIVNVRPEKSFFNVALVAVGVALLFVPGGQAIGTGLILSGVSGIVAELLAPKVDAQEIKEADGRTERQSITGSENSTSRSILPVMFGTHLQTPFYGQNPYRLVSDGSSGNLFRQYFVSNYNNVTQANEKLGLTSINDYSSDYLTITRSFGGVSFIGFDSVKPVTREEQLSVDINEAVFQFSTHIYNETDTSTSLDYDFILEFTNVVIGSWGNKTFKVTVNCELASVPVVLTQNFTVAVGDLTLVSGTTYRYTGTHSFTTSIDEVVSTRFEPVTDTRVTIAEQDNETSVIIVEEEITTDGFNDTIILNQGVNKYVGVVSEVVETSPDNTKEIDLVFSFPAGLYTQNSDGSRSARNVNISVQFKETGGSYVDIDTATMYVRDLDGVKQPLSSSTTTVSGDVVTFTPPDDIKQADELFFRTIGFEVPTTGEYVTRVRSADLFEKSDKDLGYPVFSEFNFFVDDDALDNSILPNVNQIAVKALAYKKLSGELKQYNYIASAEIPNWNGSDWTTVEATSNPASVVRYLLTDTMVNPRAEDVSLLDNDSLVELWEFCDTKGYKADGVVTTATKIGRIVAEILDNAQALFTIVDGKYHFVIDDEEGLPVDMFVPHNTFNFVWTPNVGEISDAFRVKFINKDTYKQDELTLYWYNDTANLVPDTGLGDSDYNITVREVNYMTDEADIITRFSFALETIQTKRNNFEFSVNLEALSLKLYDRVLVANSCDMEGEVSGLIKEVVTSGGNITGFKTYAPVEVEPGSYITIRSIDTGTGEFVINSYEVQNSGLTEEFNITPVVNDGKIKGKGTLTGFSGATWDYDGDAFDIGLSTVYTCLITGIRYNEDLTATITAREA